MNSARYPPIDVSVLSDTVGDDPAFHDELLCDFANALADGAAALDRSLNMGLAPLAATAHRLKGSARGFGATRLAGILEELESSCLLNRRVAAEASLRLSQIEAKVCLGWIRARLGDAADSGTKA